MGYQSRPRARTSRGFDRPKRVKSKTSSKKSRLIGTYPEEQNAPSIEEVVSRILNSLRNLGNQKFALAPFYEHFNRWLMNMQTVLTDFESSQTVAVDDQFREERSKIFSYIESALIDKRLKEESREESIRRIPSSKNILSQMEQEHITKAKEITDRKGHTIKPLMDKVDVLQRELDGIRRMRTGFLRGISNKAKALKEEEATIRLTSAKKELEEAVRSYATEEMSFREEYEHRKQEILKQIANDQKEIERLDSALQVDGSAEARRISCENLADAIKALLKRIEPASENAGSPL